MITSLETPIGNLKIVEMNDQIVEISRCDEIYHDHCDVLDECVKQLLEYFDKKRTIFTFPYHIEEKYANVYQELVKVEYGKTISYKQLAINSNNAGKNRLMGHIMHCNKLLLVVPCHRVINSNGSLGGFGLGVDAKAYLLALEKKGVF
ncbi:MAG: methylated-DNA--[protein]-cysteine S-methyltransferase [Firmicutes bacterium]|nr:methylated-DNA--[protein]-cysteine S-methyltransferase [Bacillota bacterium]